MSVSVTPSEPPVPRRARRWGRGLIILGLILVLIGAGLVLAWMLLGTTVAREAERTLNRAVFDPDSTRIHIGDVGGFPLGRVEFIDVRLERRVGEEWFTFVGADRAVARFNPLDFARGRYRVGAVDADGLVLTLREGANGGLLLPVTRGGGGGGGGGLGVDRLTARGGRFDLELPGVGLHLTDVEGALSLAISGGVTAEIASLRGDLADSLGTMRLDGGRIVAGRGVRLEALTGRWDASPFEVHGELGNDLEGKGTLVFRARDLDLDRVGRLLALPGFEPGHVHEGELTLHPGPPVTFDVTGRGRWDGWELENLSAHCTVDPDAFRVERGSLETRGISVSDATVLADVASPRVEITGRFAGLRTDSLTMIPNMDRVKGRFAGRAHVTIPDRDRWEEDLIADVETGPGSVLGRSFDRASALVRGGLAGWRIERSAVVIGGASVTASGWAAADSLDLAFRYEGSLLPLRAWTPAPDLDGRAHLSGTLQGPPLAPRVALSGRAEPIAVRGLRATAVEILEASGSLGDPETGAGRRLDVELSAPRSLTAGPMTFASAAVTLTVLEDRVEAPLVEAALGDTLVRGAGSFRWRPDPVIGLERLKISLDGRSFRLAEPAEIAIDRRGTFSTDGVTVLAERGSVTARGSFRPEGRVVDANLVLRDIDPTAFASDPAALPVQLASADGEVELHGAIPLLDGSGRLLLKEIRFGDAGFDSLVAGARVEGPTILVDDLRLHRGRGTLRAAGDVRLAAPLYSFLEAGVFGPEPDPDSTLWNVDVTADDIRLAEWFAHLPRSTRPQGRVSGTLHVGGSSAAPDVRIEGDASEILWRRFQADLLELHGGVTAGLATVDSLALWRSGQSIRVSGTIPVRLTLDPATAAVGEGDMDLRVVADGGSLESLRLTPWVEEASGVFRGEMRVRGRPERPLLSGTIRVENAEIQPKDRDEVLKKVGAEIAFDNDLVTVLAARADLGGGTVNAEGTYRLYASELESYGLTVEARDAVVRENARYAARVSGRLRLAPRAAADGRIYPYATGDVKVSRAEYVGSLQPQDIMQLQPQPILYDVTIDAPSHIYVRTEELEAELSADLEVRQEPSERVIRGTMEILSGTYQLFLRKFDITSGTLTWAEAGTDLPTMDVTAETFEGDAIVGVHWTGRADQPVIEFSARDPDTGSDLGLSQEEIVRRLAVGSFGLGLLGVAGTETGSTEGGSQTVGYLVEGSKLFMREIEQAILDQVGFFDDVKITPEYYGRVDGREAFDFRLAVRKWLTPELSLRYEQGLSRNFDQDVAVEYRLGRAVVLRGQSTRERVVDEASATREYNLDVKFRFEY